LSSPSVYASGSINRKGEVKRGILWWLTLLSCFERLRWILANSGLEIRECHGLDTHLKRTKHLTGDISQKFDKSGNSYQ
jgi:hypothetical protein